MPLALNDDDGLIAAVKRAIGQSVETEDGPTRHARASTISRAHLAEIDAVRAAAQQAAAAAEPDAPTVNPITAPKRRSDDLRRAITSAIRNSPTTQGDPPA